MSLVMWGAAAAAGYLAGSVSFTRIVTRLLRPGEPLKPAEVPVEGTDMIYKVTATGATAASMQLGGRAGCAIGLLDMLKAAVPVLLFRLLYPDELYLLAAAVAAMAGHNWPVFHRFRGGRGISAYYGGLLVIDWVGALVTAAVGMLAGFLVVKDFFVAYMAGLWLLIPWMAILTGRWEYVVYAAIVNVLYMVAMLPDIRQYTTIKKTASVDPKAVLETNPMGRGMLKISEWIRKTLPGRDKNRR